MPNEPYKYDSLTRDPETQGPTNHTVSHNTPRRFSNTLLEVVKKLLQNKNNNKTVIPIPCRDLKTPMATRTHMRQLADRPPWKKKCPPPFPHFQC